MSLASKAKRPSVHSQLTIFDDAVQEAGTDVSRSKLKDLIDTLASNIPDAGTLKVYLGTRYHLQDYYGGMIQLLNEDPTALRFICEGAVKRKIGYADVPWNKLEFEQIELLWPGKIGSSPEKTWADLKKKIKRNLNDFLCQQQNDPPDTDNSDDLICFDPDMVMKHVKDPALFPQSDERYVVVDVSYSTDNRADFGVVAVAAEALNDKNPGEPSLYFVQIEAKRRSNADLALAMVEAVQQFGPIRKLVLEKVNGVELLIAEARRQASARGIAFPEVSVIKIDLTKGAKWNRIKNSQMLMAADRIFISDKCESLMLALDQYTRYDGRPSSQRRKDDCPDAIALLALQVLHVVDESPNYAAARLKQEEDERARQIAQEHYDAVFEGKFYRNVSTGRDWIYGIPTPTSDDTDQESDRIGAFGIPCAPRFAGQSLTPNKKMVSFGDTIRKK